MAEVIPGDSVYLGERHTARHMRRGALWIPGISVRAATEPGDDVVSRARDRARDLLASHEVEPLPDDVERQLDEILERARRELVAG
jgi:trimethylamine--corrinoid protein Co-methyltransferase